MLLCFSIFSNGISYFLAFEFNVFNVFLLCILLETFLFRVGLDHCTISQLIGVCSFGVESNGWVGNASIVAVLDIDVRGVDSV